MDMFQSSSSSLRDGDDEMEPTRPLRLHNDTEPTSMQSRRLELQPPQQQLSATHNNNDQRTARMAMVSFSDHVEIQLYEPTPEYNTDDESVDYAYHDAISDMLIMNDDSDETDNIDTTSSEDENVMINRGLDSHNINNISTDRFGLPTVDTSLTPPPTTLHHVGGESHSRGNDFLLQQQHGMCQRRPLHHPHMLENLQGYTDLADFATLTDSSNSDTDSHDSLSQGLFVPRHFNLAEQLISSSVVPPTIVVDEYDRSSSSGSVISELHTQHHFIDPNLYPLQYPTRNDGDDDDHINPEYYFEVQSLDSCFMPRDRQYCNGEGDSNISRSNRHPHYRLSMLKQRLRESMMAIPQSLTQFRSHNRNNGSPEETDADVSNSNCNDDNTVLAEAILLP